MNRYATRGMSCRLTWRFSWQMYRRLNWQMGYRMPRPAWRGAAFVRGSTVATGGASGEILTAATRGARRRAMSGVLTEASDRAMPKVADKSSNEQAATLCGRPSSVLSGGFSVTSSLVSVPFSMLPRTDTEATKNTEPMGAEDQGSVSSDLTSAVPVRQCVSSWLSISGLGMPQGLDFGDRAGTIEGQ
jgi:hypothetical protein